MNEVKPKIGMLAQFEPFIGTHHIAYLVSLFSKVETTVIKSLEFVCTW